MCNRVVNMKCERMRASTVPRTLSRRFFGAFLLGPGHLDLRTFGASRITIRGVSKGATPHETAPAAGAAIGRTVGLLTHYALKPYGHWIVQHIQTEAYLRATSQELHAAA